MAIPLGHIKQLRIVFSALDPTSRGLRELLQRVATDKVEFSWPCNVLEEGID